MKVRVIVKHDFQVANKVAKNLLKVSKCLRNVLDESMEIAVTFPMAMVVDHSRKKGRAKICEVIFSASY